MDEQSLLQDPFLNAQREARLSGYFMTMKKPLRNSVLVQSLILVGFQDAVLSSASFEISRGSFRLAKDRMVEPEQMGRAERSKRSHKLHAAARKVYLLMCWVHDQPGEAWSSLAGTVKVEKSSLSEPGHSDKPAEAEWKAASRTKVLIEEV